MTAQSTPSATDTAQSRGYAMVTGASSGIGLELARQLAQRGYDLLVVAEDDAITSVGRTIGNADGDGRVEVEACRADLATADGVTAALAALTRVPDVVCLNAGVGTNGPFVDNDLDDERRLIALNVAAPVEMAHAVLRQMVEAGSGRVLFTASTAATMPGPYYATYAASKAFLLSFAEAVRSELTDTGVTVTALMPGPTDTQFFDRAGMQDTPAGQMSKDDPAGVAADGLTALFDGKDHVVGGSVKNKAQVLAGKVLPERAKAFVHGTQTKPETE